MSKPAAPSSTKDTEHDLPHAAPTHPPRPSSPPQGGRWWFVFDRWLAATEVASAQDEFVMA